jgi:hypothetical protein
VHKLRDHYSIKQYVIWTFSLLLSWRLLYLGYCQRETHIFLESHFIKRTEMKGVIFHGNADIHTVSQDNIEQIVKRSWELRHIRRRILKKWFCRNHTFIKIFLRHIKYILKTSIIYFQQVFSMLNRQRYTLTLKSYLSLNESSENGLILKSFTDYFNIPLNPVLLLPKPRNIHISNILPLNCFVWYWLWHLTT